MPTFNQLVHKGRQTLEKKSTAPALQRGWNSQEENRYRPELSSEERRLHSNPYSDPQEAELGSP